MSFIASKAHHESELERYIVEKLHEQGWVVGNSNNYHTEYALYPDDLEAWIKATQPEKWEKLESLNGSSTLDRLMARLDDQLERHGTIHVFRNGFTIAGAGTIDMSESEPEDGRNQAVIERYNANILRVVPQLKYHPSQNSGVIDLAFFINGLPMATAEIKTELTQPLQNAINQYRRDRNPICPRTRRKEPLLTPKRGAIVHFALCESEIAMTTELKGENTYFLPFNKGNNGKAGNPPADAAKGELYPIAYFYDYVCKRENWLKIFHQFVYTESRNRVGLDGRAFKQERMIFPRYHQFDAVTKIVADVKNKGVGLNYLCEHSAGSGKTSTISWVSHSLIRLRHNDGTPYFNSIIVVTDRTVLDDQLQEAIQQIDHQSGLIAAIDRDNKAQAGKTKSKQLEEALLASTPIIIVTIQTFPYVMEAILHNTSLRDRKYGIVIDEAHNSQTGSTATKLQATLVLDSHEDMAKMTVEELTAKIQKLRVQSNSISHFAFTATPKHSTKMLFGRTADDKPASNDNLPLSFHLYPQRQAIDEGFILDVLQGYTPYKTAFELGSTRGEEEDERVSTKEARRAIARWSALHPTNVTQKVEFIINHFHANVAKLLNGQAKAMIVTGSRAAAVRYKLALEEYFKSNPEYAKYGVLAAFSGKITGKDIYHDQDAVLDEGAAFRIDGDKEFTEANINDAPNADLRIAFDRPEYRLMVVADKFQTGFDQPKLCAMYLDKVIGNEVEVVQTLSRLNRTAPGKEQTFIIDFVNDPDWIQKCFEKYDSGAKIVEIQDPNVVYTIKDNIDELNLITKTDLEEFKQVRFRAARDAGNVIAFDTTHAELYRTTDRIARDYNERLKDLNRLVKQKINEYNTAKANGNEIGANRAELERKQYDAELQSLTRFKSNLNRFARVYSYIAQLIDFGDPDLENFSAFAKLLAKRLSGVPRQNVDISGLVLTGYSILNEQHAPSDPESDDSRDSGGKDSNALPAIKGNANSDIQPTQMEYLNEVIKMLSSAFGDTSDPDNQSAFINQILSILRKDTTVMAQIRNNPKEIAMRGNLPSATTGAVIQALTSHKELSSLLLKTDAQAMKTVVNALYLLLKNDGSVEMPTK